MLPKQQSIYEDSRKYKESLQDKKYRSEPIRRVLIDKIDELDRYKFSPNSESVQSLSLLHVLDWALDQPELVDPTLLASYLAHLIRLMENAGAGMDFRTAIDKAINFYKGTNQPMLDLYLAKVEYLRLRDTQSNEKEKALDEARQALTSSDETIRFMIKQSQYYIDTSQYQSAILSCNDALKYINEHKDLNSYNAKLFDMLGIVYFYLFKYDTSIEYLKRACEEGEKYDEHVLGEALHFLGRVYADQGDSFTAMQHLIEGSKHQRLNLADAAWYHLRMGNILTKADLLIQARDHLSSAQELFRQIDYRGSALAQVELAWAEVFKMEKKYKEAEEHILQALEFSKSTFFFRGQLLCMVNLFWLQLIYMKRLDKAIVTFFTAMLNQEIRRNAGVQLILSYLIKVLLVPIKWITRSKYTVPGTVSVNVVVKSCLCPTHGGNESGH